MTDTQTRADLLPCPFCGSAFKMGREPHDNWPVAGMFYIYHDYGPVGSAARECPIEVQRHFQSEAEVLAAWNTRAPTADAERIAALEGEVERLRKALMVLRDLPIVENDNPDTLHIDGVAYQGPAVDFLFYFVRKTKMISRAALEGTSRG